MTLTSGGRELPASTGLRFIFSIFALFTSLAIAGPVEAQQYDPALYAGMLWRQVGPFRAGRVTDVTGVPGQPAIYYMGTAGGGAWKVQYAVLKNSRQGERGRTRPFTFVDDSAIFVIDGIVVHPLPLSADRCP